MDVWTRDDTYGVHILHSNVQLARDNLRWLILIVNIIGFRMTQVIDFCACGDGTFPKRTEEETKRRRHCPMGLGRKLNQGRITFSLLPGDYKIKALLPPQGATFPLS